MLTLWIFLCGYYKTGGTGFDEKHKMVRESPKYQIVHRVLKNKSSMSWLKLIMYRAKISKKSNIE